MTKARETSDVLNSRGTAATADVQTSPTDLTAGRVLLTGSIDSDGNVWGASNVEYGSNANGDYIKYPDGRLEVLKSVTGDSGGFVATTFPETFVGNYRVSGISTTSSTNAVISLKVLNKAATTLDFAVVAASGYTNVGCDMTIIGRWK